MPTLEGIVDGLTAFQGRPLASPWAQAAAATWAEVDQLDQEEEQFTVDVLALLDEEDAEKLRAQETERADLSFGEEDDGWEAVLPVAPERSSTISLESPSSPSPTRAAAGSTSAPQALHASGADLPASATLAAPLRSGSTLAMRADAADDLDSEDGFLD
jgi:hypothetical protein